MDSHTESTEPYNQNMSTLAATPLYFLSQNKNYVNVSEYMHVAIMKWCGGTGNPVQQQQQQQPQSVGWVGPA